MSKFDDWFYETEGWQVRAERCYNEIETNLNPSPKILEWLFAAYKQGFQDGYNSPTPPTDFV